MIKIVLSDYGKECAAAADKAIDAIFNLEQYKVFSIEEITDHAATHIANLYNSEGDPVEGPMRVLQFFMRVQSYEDSINITQWFDPENEESVFRIIED